MTPQLRILAFFFFLCLLLTTTHAYRRRFTCCAACFEFSSANCNRPQEPSCDFAPDALLGKSVTRLRCCSSRPAANVSWSTSEDGRNFERICTKTTHDTELQIQAGSNIIARRNLNGSYRCTIVFKDGVREEITKRVVFSSEISSRRNLRPTFQGCRRSINVSANINTKLDRALKTTFESGVVLVLSIFKDEHLLIQCRLVPYCLRLKKYLIETDKEGKISKNDLAFMIICEGKD